MVDSRTAAHTLSQIAAYLELRGENRLRHAHTKPRRRAFSLLAPTTSRLCWRRVRSAACADSGQPRSPSFVISSSWLVALSRSASRATPEGLLDMLKIPGLSAEKIHKIYEELEISDVGELEEAARDGRLAKIRGFGPKTAERDSQRNCVLA